MYHYTDGGLRNVWLANGYVVHETKYGKGISFHDTDGLTIGTRSGSIFAGTVMD